MKFWQTVVLPSKMTLLQNSSSILLIPAFTKNKPQLSAEEVEVTRKIASVRIHIERVIGLLINRYTILKGILPMRTVKSIKDETCHAITANCDNQQGIYFSLTNRFQFQLKGHLE